MSDGKDKGGFTPHVIDGGKDKIPETEAGNTLSKSSSIDNLIDGISIELAEILGQNLSNASQQYTEDLNNANKNFLDTVELRLGDIKIVLEKVFTSIRSKVNTGDLLKCFDNYVDSTNWRNDRSSEIDTYENNIISEIDSQLTYWRQEYSLIEIDVEDFEESEFQVLMDYIEEEIRELTEVIDGEIDILMEDYDDYNESSSSSPYGWEGSLLQTPSKVPNISKKKPWWKRLFGN